MRWWVLGSVAVAGLLACSSFSSDGGSETTPLDGGAVEADGSVAPKDDAATPDGDAGCSGSPGATVPFAAPGGSVSQLVSNPTHILWVRDGTTVQRQAIGGTTIETVVTPGVIQAMAATPGYVVMQIAGGGTYFARNAADAGDAGYGGSVYAPYAVAPQVGVERAFGFNSTGPSLYRIDPPGGGGGLTDKAAGLLAIAANSSAVYYLGTSDAGVNAVYRLDQVSGGQTPTAVVRPSAHNPVELAVSADTAFMHDGAGTLFMGPLVDSGVEDVLTTNEASLGRIVVKGKQVYYGTGLGLRRIDLTTRCKTSLSTAPVTQFTVTDADVYFVGPTGEILRVPR